MQAALATLLLIIYNCSDQIITIRERRLARSREAAAKVVKEKIQARARWKAAKEAAKKHAVELQGQLSRKFSRKRNVTISDKVTVMNQEDTDIDDNSYSSKEHSTSSVSKNSLSTSEVEELGSIPLMEVINEIEDHTFDSSESFSLEIKEKNLKTKKPKGKEIQTHSQIFKYAYAQLEREKAQQQQNKNLTFSGVISMATNTDYKKRPVIEIGFTGLTVTLKGKKKHLLRSVNGKIMPGRITAVMGPSGAGKTTLLSALAGKTVGCTISGSILINGKPEPIHSYRKIVGFVPQDDIVHGNLTVEENLWFNARCRYVIVGFVTYYVFATRVIMFSTGYFQNFQSLLNHITSSKHIILLATAGLYLLVSQVHLIPVAGSLKDKFLTFCKFKVVSRFAKAR